MIYASDEVDKILSIAERVFRQFVSGTSPIDPKFSAEKRLHLKLLTKTVYEATTSNSRDCSPTTWSLPQILHSSQLIKEIA